MIYFYHTTDMPLYLLMIYAKARQENLSPEEMRDVQAIVGMLKRSQRR